MRWERAKNLMLLFFFLLNIFLASFLYQEQRRYVLSPEQEQAIRTMFTQNNISWYIHFIRQYPPMRPLAVSGFDYDMDRLITIFFENAPAYAVDRNRDIYEDGETKLIVSNGYISYENPYGLDGFELRNGVLNRENAITLCEDFVRRFYPGYTQDYVLHTTEGFRLYFREQYRGHTIHSNFILFFVTENGITRVEMQYGTVEDFSGAVREICAPDEALLTFIQRIRSMRTEGSVMIDRMDIVYYQPEISAKENGDSLHAIPYYRIFISENEVPFKIDAYRNVCIN